MKLGIGFIFCLVIFACATATPEREPAGQAEVHPSIRISTQCKVACRGEDHVTRLGGESQIFDPEETRYFHVNNNAAPLLSIRLQGLADEECVRVAQRRCGTDQAIQRVQATQIRSGRWSVHLPLDCSKSRFESSPFDPVNLLKVEKAKEDVLFPAYPTATFNTKIPVMNAGREAPVAHCQHPIHGQVCYGDCYADGMETLMTPSANVYEAKEVCGDALLVLFAQNHTASALREIECRKFYYQEIERTSSDNLGCSAFRASLPDCARFSN